MSFDIGSSSVLRRLSGQSHASEHRRSYLQKLASLHVRGDFRVGFMDMGSPANCAWDDRQRRYKVNITNRSLDDLMNRNNSSLRPKYEGYDTEYLTAFFQEGLLYHELGHVLFSDFDALQEVASNVEMSYRDRFKKLVNRYEDSVIEPFLREYINGCGTVLQVKNELKYDVYRQEKAALAQVDDLKVAGLVAEELGRYDEGLIEVIEAMEEDYSEVIEAATECFYDVITEPNAKKRYERILDLWNELELYYNNDPDDWDNIDWAKTGQELEVTLVPTPEEEEMEGDEDEEGLAPAEQEEVDEEDLEQLKQEKEEREENAQTSQKAQQLSNEMSKGIGAGGGPGELKVRDPYDATGSEKVAKKAKMYSRYLERTIEDYWRKNSGYEERREETHGRFDSTKLIAAERGSTKCFKSSLNKDEVGNTIFLLLDESGSMSGSDITQAAIGTAAIARAFEEAGADVYVWRFSSSVYLCKTPSMSYNDVENSLSSENTGGGTTLLPGLERVSEIAQNTDDQTYLFVATDGCPSNVDGCKEQLRNFPGRSACLQIGDTGRGFEQSYDAFAKVESGDEIQRKATSLIRRVVLE